MQDRSEYYESDEFQELLGEYEENMEKGMPIFMDADDLVEIADFYEWQGRRDEADEAVDKALELDPTCAAALAFKVGDALETMNLAKAHFYLDQITDTDDPEYVYSRAEVMIAEDKAQECDQWLLELFKDTPDDERDDFVMDAMNIYCDWEHYDLALQWMMRMQPVDNDDFRELVGRIYYGTEQYEKCEETFKQLLDSDPFNLRYWVTLASAQYMLCKYEEALASSEYAIAIDPTAGDALLGKANALFHMERYDEAYQFFDRYTEVVPDDALAEVNKAACLINSGRYTEGLEMLQQMLSDLKDDDELLLDVYHQMAFAYGELGRFDDALDILELMMKLPNCQLTQVEVTKGHMQLAAGRLQEAEDTFRQAVNRSNKPMQTLLQVIVSLYDNGLLTTSYNMMGRFFLLQEQDAHDGYGYMALFCHDLKREAEYLHYLQLACRHNTSEAYQALHHLFPHDIAPADYYDYAVAHPADGDVSSETNTN